MGPTTPERGPTWRACWARAGWAAGGALKAEDATLFEEIRAIRAGGGFGSMIGRNSFQRSQADALAMLAEAARLLRD